MIRLYEPARAVLAVAATFIMGFVVGCSADRTVLNPPASAAARATQSDVARHHDEVLGELRTELGLSAEQYARVQAIFTARQAEMEAAWTQVHASLQGTMQKTTAEVETVLDPAQVQRFRAWIAERHGSKHGAHSRREH